MNKSSNTRGQGVYSAPFTTARDLDEAAIAARLRQKRDRLHRVMDGDDECAAAARAKVTLPTLRFMTDPEPDLEPR